MLTYRSRQKICSFSTYGEELSFSRWEFINSRRYRSENRDNTRQGNCVVENSTSRWDRCALTGPVINTGPATDLCCIVHSVVLRPQIWNRYILYIMEPLKKFDTTPNIVFDTNLARIVKAAPLNLTPNHSSRHWKNYGHQVFQRIEVCKLHNA